MLGAATLIGSKTGKIVGFSSRIKQCRTCNIAKKYGREPHKHICKKNWSASAKAMEPDMLVEMLKKTNDKGVPVGTVVGDDDTTGISRVRAEVDRTIEKLSDKNHTRKNITCQLYAIRKNHKELSEKVISAITKNFNYMLSQNVGNTESVKVGLRATVDHLFGDHSNCSENWCGYFKNPGTYKHRNLPFGKNLKSEALKKDLHKIFVEGLEGKAEKLANLSSSQANESFNNTLASKAPKSHHYSDSASFSYRLCAAVCQKNEGYSYVSGVCRCTIVGSYSYCFFTVDFYNAHNC